MPRAHDMQHQLINKYKCLQGAMCYRKNTSDQRSCTLIRERKAKALQELTKHKTDFNEVWHCVVKTVRAIGFREE